MRQSTRRNIHYLQKESNEIKNGDYLSKNISKHILTIRKKIEKKDIHGNNE